MNKDHQTIALICCRGGSKGIPKKNIKLFAEKPLLGWTLETAKESKVFDDIILSTDSEEIANVGRDYGVTVPGLRPEHLARDDSDQFDTHSHIFSQLSITDKTHRVCILVNNPLINVRLIKESYSKAFSQKFHKIVLDCVPVEDDFVFYRQCYESGNGELRFQFPFAMLNSGTFSFHLVTRYRIFFPNSDFGYRTATVLRDRFLQSEFVLPLLLNLQRFFHLQFCLCAQIFGLPPQLFQLNYHL